MAKGEDESWFRTTHADSASTDREAMSVRVSDPAQSMPKRPFAGDGDSACCCCCGPRWGRKYTVEVRDASSNGNVTPARTGVLRTKGRWEIDVDEEYYKPPVWKQLVRKLKAQARQVNYSSSARGEWVNYDPQSYEKNFDDGSWRDCTLRGEEDEEGDERGLKQRALHTALLQKFASNRSQNVADGAQLSPVLSPLPVRPLSKEEIDKYKEEFVPIWQRRAATPIKLDLRLRACPQA